MDTIQLVDLYRGDSKRPEWKKLASDERFHGAFLKVSEGTWYDDSGWLRDNWADARAAGGRRYGRSWFRGAYHYLRFFEGDEAKKGFGAAQADDFLARIEAAGGWGAGDLLPVV